jgi:DUF1365 family protein
MHSAIYEGTIFHRRMSVRAHQFRYRVAMAYLDLDEIDELGDGMLTRARPGIVRFRRRDYLGDPEIPLIDAVRAVVADQQGTAPQGPVRLLTHLRTFGHCFNPVSFYYCFAPDGERLETIVAEVTNTPWGERHAYVLAWNRDTDEPRGTFTKALHVSPFMRMDQQYTWRASVPGFALLIHLSSIEHGTRVFDATLRLRHTPFDRQSLVRNNIRHPMATLRMLALIYAHAVALKLKGVRVQPHPGAQSS